MKTTPHPASEGWIKMDTTLTSGKPLSEDQIKRIATHGHQDNYEFGPISQNGKRLRVTMREKRHNQT